MKEELIIIFVAIGVIQAIFLSAGLIGKEKKTVTNLYLVLLLLSYAIVLVHKYLVSTVWILDHLFFFYLTFSTPLLIGPFFYFYVNSVLDYPRSFKKTDLWHLTPFLMVFGFFLASGFSVSAVRYQSGQMPEYITYLGSFKALHMIAYAAVASIHFFKTRKTQRFDRLNKELKLWLALFIYAFNITLLIGLVSFILGHFDLSVARFLDDIPILALVFLLYVVSYYAIRYPLVFEMKTKYQGSKLSSGQSRGIFESLQRLMQHEQFYLNAELRLDTMANSLSTSSHNLSRVINELEGKNFQDYVNTYRVEALKAMLKDDSRSHMTILALGMEAGFSSKTAMNRAFKKQVGCTPSDYQKNG